MKKFFAIFCAIIILVASVPSFAAYDFPEIPWDILSRTNLFVCGDPWYSGRISDSALATDAVSRVIQAGSSVYAVLLTEGDDTVQATVCTYITTPVDRATSYWGYYSGSLALTEPFYQSSKINCYTPRVNYSGTISDFDFSSIQGDTTSGPLNFNLSSYSYCYISDDISTLTMLTNTGATFPGEGCDGTFSVTNGTNYQAVIPSSSPIDPGYSGPAAITLQPGNLLIFERSGGFAGVPDIRILADNLPRSPLIGPWTTRNTIKSFDSLPDPTSVFVLPYLEWTAVPGTTDWLGRSSVGTASWQISQYTDDFAVYLNPIFGTDVSGGLLGDSSADYNPPNKIFIEDVSDYDKIMLVSVVNRYGQSYIDYENGSILYDASFTDDGTPEFTPAGSDTPSSDANRPGGATDITGTPGGTTQGLISRILEFLESGIDRFASIADAGRSFIESCAEMFSWLPDEVRSVIVSGIIIVIMMGVLSRFI